MNDDIELVQKILDTITKITSVDRRRVIAFDKSRLYPSEIHLLMSIHAGQNTNLTKIAKHIGLTKGAISQTLTRLQKKGVIIKKPDTNKKNELHLTFTTKGEKLMEHIIKLKKTLSFEYLQYLKNHSEKEKQIISNFLDKLIDTISSAEN
ncbi:MAG: MarR family transcriptional regulator [Candidatus Lokiarchaeota archaeon]|nr:MarR family transcriptional regulator [Candidatus Lokiarchaeota archaeon]